jgi:hypothetical protein
MIEGIEKTEIPKVTITIDWKNFFIVLFLGTTLMGMGIVGYYQFELGKLAPSLPIKSSKIASPVPKATTPSAKQATPSSDNVAP